MLQHAHSPGICSVFGSRSCACSVLIESVCLDIRALPTETLSPVPHRPLLQKAVCGLPCPADWTPRAPHVVYGNSVVGSIILYCAFGLLIVVSHKSTRRRLLPCTLFTLCTPALCTPPGQDPRECEQLLSRRSVCLQIVSLSRLLPPTLSLICCCRCTLAQAGP